MKATNYFNTVFTKTDMKVIAKAKNLIPIPVRDIDLCKNINFEKVYQKKCGWKVNGNVWIIFLS